MLGEDFLSGIREAFFIESELRNLLGNLNGTEFVCKYVVN